MSISPTVQRPMAARVRGPLRGCGRAPRDQSISHRALILGLLATGESRIEGLAESADVLGTVAAIRAFGARALRHGPGDWSIWGCGIGSLLAPVAPLEVGGIGGQLIMGIAAGHGFEATFTGAAAPRLRSLLDGLVRMGAEANVQAEPERCLVFLRGTPEPAPIDYLVSRPCAALKSAILLAGLNSPGAVTVREAWATADHTETMLRHFGAEVLSKPYGQEGRKVTLRGRPDLRGTPVHVPGDPSAAAYAVVAALIVPGSDIVIEDVSLNPLRIGLLMTLCDMGAQIDILKPRQANGEDVADLRVRHSVLRGIEVPAARSRAIGDGYPLLATAAAFAQGQMRLCGAAERSDSASPVLVQMVAGLAQAGVPHRVEGSDLIIESDGRVSGGACISAPLDPRAAMSLLVLGLGAREPVTVADSGTIATNFPDFHILMSTFGTEFEAA
ncbi:3-phosphoshikimate 1-carboxyvinyltransferase [Methylovirgula sp. 4M-Z18]|uniref:3-phosphoshikimate 1-carboxyvinyltransferase n=1 Tax=Methylovirgula sp. 4M-Z18 TaxID=2293567 RepID=UPI000E2F747A|nr:3-phosphoshikimate 1-carboxyvinyltransferase [Methylovirgula sp. 4M-Z18]RFB75523.1 3-phosphoshikimate 1-carboxyvinyltransferase [Methylovirgula sp. 4M-Z18]